MFIIIFSNSNAISEDSIAIPNGVYHGKLVIGGDIYCVSTVHKIKVQDNNITIFSDDILGPRRYNFKLNEDKFENRLFQQRDVTSSQRNNNVSTHP